MVSTSLLKRINKLSASMSGGTDLCSRLKRMKNKVKDPAKKDDPNSRINKSLQKHKCASDWSKRAESLLELHRQQEAEKQAEDKEAGSCSGDKKKAKKKGYSKKADEGEISLPELKEDELKELSKDVKLAAADKVLALLIDEIRESAEKANA